VLIPASGALSMSGSWPRRRRLSAVFAAEGLDPDARLDPDEVVDRGEPGGVVEVHLQRHVARRGDHRGQEAHRPLHGEHPGLVADQEGAHALDRGELRHLVCEVGVGVHRGGTEHDLR
jgi:hypothetical protein